MKLLRAILAMRVRPDARRVSSIERVFVYAVAALVFICSAYIVCICIHELLISLRWV